MKVPLKWLSEFVSLSEPLQNITHRLTMTGLEVDAIDAFGDVSPSLLVARILTIEPVLEDQGLLRCHLGLGGQRTAEVVSRAPNLQVGAAVVYAPPGSSLPDGRIIQSAIIHGIRSDGMMCSAREIGLGDIGTGILVLDAHHVEGTSIADIDLGKDTVLEISITPNRPDCLSIRGIAREIASLTSCSLVPSKESGPDSALGTGPLAVSVDSPLGCFCYFGRSIGQVTVAPSSLEMALRLAAAGVRSINNVVDITNYLLLGVGQPLHAFDADQLVGTTISVRLAHDGERILCLDGIERTLSRDDIVIADGAGPVALAGVMGGQRAAVTEHTRRVFLESAQFNPLQVRATARRFMLHTEASHRFERGVDSFQVRYSLDLATELLRALAGGTPEGDCVGFSGGATFPLPIAVRPTYVNALLGMQIPTQRMVGHLSKLAMKAEHQGAVVYVTPPAYRLDILTEEDVVEEIARAEGYQNIPTTFPSIPMRSPSPGHLRRQQRLISQILTGMGLDQLLCYTFVSREHLLALRLDPSDPRLDPILLLNPISEELSVLRTTLIPSLVRTAAHNLSHKNNDFRLYEVGKVFAKQPGSDRVSECLQLGMILGGRRFERSWGFSPGDVDIHDLTGILKGLFEQLGISEPHYGASPEPYLVPGHGWSIELEGNKLGHFGRLHPLVGKSLGVESPVLVLELSVAGLWAHRSPRVHFQPSPRFPSVERDLALLLRDELPVGQMLEIIRQSGGSSLERIGVFDVYRGSKLPDGMKSIGFGLVFRANDRTLTDAEVDQQYSNIVETCKAAVGAVVR